MDLSPTLREQLAGHWTHQLRPRLEGLTDEEYLWEPVSGCWSLRPRAQVRAPRSAGAGDLRLEYAHPEPEPSPITTIAWRLAHLIVGCFAARSASHFGAPPADYDSWTYAGTADEALRQLDEQYAVWRRASWPSVRTVSRVPADRRRDRSPRPRWPGSCSTSTAR